MLGEVSSKTELHRLGASALARLVATGEVSASELVQAYIERIEAVNPSLNALVVPLFEQARAEASRADEARSQGQSLGPLHGVPITIKECFDVAGTPSTAGIESRRNHRASQDGPLVARLRQAGAIIVGKTNVPQTLLNIECDNPVYGRTNNPWNGERSSMGSSGGEAALIAAGGSALGLGSDIGGSLRLPPHACGVNGLKPTGSRLSLIGTFDELMLPGQEAIRDAAGPIARHVEDLSLAMTVMSRDLWQDDPAVPPVPFNDPTQVRLTDLRVGFYTDDGFFKAAPALRRAVTHAVEALRARGVAVEEFRPPHVERVMYLFNEIIAGAARLDTVRRELGSSPRDKRIASTLQLVGLPNFLKVGLAGLSGLAGQRNLASELRSVHSLNAAGYWRVVADRARYRQEFAQALTAQRLDVLLCPPFSLPALTHGSSFWLTNAASYAMLFNVLDYPAGVVAATRVRPGEESDRRPGLDYIERVADQVEKGSAGLPVGVQVAARPWREDHVLSVMAALEEHFRRQADYPEK